MADPELASAIAALVPRLRRDARALVGERDLGRRPS
jgi:hypothetical protein